MSAHNEQNGRHPNFPMQSVAPLDPRIRNFPSSEKKEVCREYVWGKCFKYGQCRFRHECSLDEMKFIIKFCHDHQNRMGCLRPNCTYLHCSSEEQNLFLSSGKLPRVLLERHAAINAAATAMPSGSVGSMENPPPLYVAQPPPPPPPPIGVSAPPPPPPPQTVTPTVIPPPPPPPPTESSIRTVPPAALYTAAPPQAPTDTTFVSQPPPTLPPIFDASRPPPPIPSASRNGNAIKSTMVDACEAGPSKIRMTEEADIICEYCIQRELSLKACNEELDAMNNNKEQKKAALKKAVDEYDKIKAMMRLLLPAEIAVAVEEISEGVHSPPVSLTLPQLMTRILDDRTDYSSAMMDTIQPSSLHELFIGYLLNATSSTERSSSVELRPSEILSSGTSSITGNGFSRLASAQRPTVTVAATVAAVTSSPAPPAPVPAPARPAYVSPPASRAYPGVAASYQPHPPPYQPAVPPPAVPPPSVPPPSVRPAYPPFAPHPMPQGTSPAPYSAIASVSAPLVNAQAAVGLSNAGPAPSVPATTKGYGHYMMGGYNSPPYYSPFQ